MKVSRKIEGCFKGVLVFLGSLRVFHESFKEEEVSRMFQGCFQSASRQLSKCFKKVAWHSLQLPKQREGLFIQFSFGKTNLVVFC